MAENTDGQTGGHTDRYTTPPPTILSSPPPLRVGVAPPNVTRELATAASWEQRAEASEAANETMAAFDEWLRAHAKEQEAREAQAGQDAGVEAPAADATEARRDNLPSYCMPLRVDPPRFDPGSEPSSDDEGKDAAVLSHAAGGAPGISPEKGSSSKGASSAGTKRRTRRTEVEMLSKFTPERKKKQMKTQTKVENLEGPNPRPRRTEVQNLEDTRGKKPAPLEWEEGGRGFLFKMAPSAASSGSPSMASLKFGGAFKPPTPKEEGQ